MEADDWLLQSLMGTTKRKNKVLLSLTFFFYFLGKAIYLFIPC